jgi:hypothetical protein
MDGLPAPLTAVVGIDDKGFSMRAGERDHTGLGAEPNSATLATVGWADRPGASLSHWTNSWSADQAASHRNNAQHDDA